MKHYAIAVTGGIGSGKSLICRILAALGYPVYDSDARAKVLMDESDEIRSRIAAEISENAIDSSGRIIRPALAQVVFSDADKLSMLNQIVHGCVLADFSRWRHQQRSCKCFVETALLYQSGLDRMVDEVWEVEAPLELKVQRVMRRNNIERGEVEARIDSQRLDSISPHPYIMTIINDGYNSVLLQLAQLLQEH